MNDADRLKLLLDELERLREELMRAMDKADGQSGDEEVTRIADEFDKLLNEYMKTKEDRE